MDSLFPIWGDAPSLCGSMTWSRTGIGAGRSGRGVHLSVWVAMRPSAFLALSTPLTTPRGSLAWLRDQVAAGRAIHPPGLEVWLPPRSGMPCVVRHDGRHRTTLARELLNEAEIPVLIGLLGPGTSDGLQAILHRSRRAMVAQRGRLVVDGPLFGEEAEEDDLRLLTGIPPPRLRHRLCRRHRCLGRRVSRDVSSAIAGVAQRRRFPCRCHQGL